MEAEEGKAIAQTLGNKKAIILQNHGLLVASPTVEATVHFYIALEKSCQVQLLADAAAAGRGERTKPIADSDAQTAYNVVGKVFPVGWFSALPHFQVLEKKEGNQFKFSKDVKVSQLPI